MSLPLAATRLRLRIYGRNLSPFARRALIWARLQGHLVERREISPADPSTYDELCAVNPAGRVPAVVLEDGATLFESWAICDWLESVAPEAERLLPSPADPAARRAATQALGLANTVAEKAVARVYESRRPEALQWAEWAGRLEAQAAGALAALEAVAPVEGYFGGDRPNGVDIAAVVAVDFLSATTPRLIEGRAPRLSALAARAQRIAAFAETRP